MAANLDISITKTLDHERLYANNPKDPGGETWRGIARRFWPRWPGWPIVDAAKATGVAWAKLAKDPALQALVLFFYRDKFSMPIYLQIANQEILDEIFDFGFNVNPPNAVKAIQESLRGIMAGPIVVDGVFGPKTLDMLNGADPVPLLREFRARQSVYYAAAMLRRFTRALRDNGVVIMPEVLRIADDYALTFALGWLRRVMA